MYVQVKAYYNRDFSYTPESMTEIVGLIVLKWDVNTRWPQDEIVCRAVFQLFNGSKCDRPYHGLLWDIARRYRDDTSMRSMRMGDLIVIRPESGEEHAYEVLPVGFRRVEREFVEV